MACKIYPETQLMSCKMFSEPPFYLEAGEKDLLMFMKNAHEYIEDKTCFVVRTRELDDKSALSVIHPNMLAWKARMLPFFQEWVLCNNHTFMDKKGCWKNDTGNVKGRWCELDICGRKCLVDFQSRYYDDQEWYWNSTNRYNYTFIIDPYCYDDTDDNWAIDWVS